MSNIQETLDSLLSVDGALATVLVDSESGMMLGKAGSGIDLELAAAGNTEVVRSKMKIMKAMNSQDKIEDILITLGREYHIIRLIEKTPGLFLLFVLSKDKANLALARRHLQNAEEGLVI